MIIWLSSKDFNDVIIGGQPAACISDMAKCVGLPAFMIIESATVWIGGQPAARMGGQTEHGGAIAVGFPQVVIGG